ncbi:SUR7/PalI family-domain-containing protein [Biscogniauxia mediterranea]|nr:SUR7/PalI family-domain-containing protein [Biscogniauxia mediterranea]
MAAARRLSWLSFGVTLVLLLLTLIFSMVILLSGVNNKDLGGFLKIDTGHLDASSKLSISEFLDEISEISNSDYHRHQKRGDDDDDDDDDNDDDDDDDQLPTSYSLTLLTLCAHDADGTTSCAEPRIGFSFDPESHLDLDTTDYEEFSEEYNQQLHMYSNISMFLSVAYIAVIIITALSCVHLGLALCFPRMLMLSKFFSLVATVLLFVAAVTAAVTFIRLKDVFNSALKDVGVRTDIGGSMVGYSFGAFGLSFFAFLCMLTQSRGDKDHHHHHGAAATRDVESKGGLVRRFTDESRGSGGPVAGILNRVATWNSQHKYTKVTEKKRPLNAAPGHHHHTPSDSSTDDRNALMSSPPSSSSSREYVEDRGLTASPEMRERLRDEENEPYDPPRMGRTPQGAAARSLRHS